MRNIIRRSIYIGSLLLLLAVILFPAGQVKAASVGTPKLQSATSVDYKSIKIKWKKVSKASGYYVLRKQGSGAFKKIATIQKGSTVTYTDKKATTGKKYTYTVQAYIKNGSKITAGSYDKKGKSATALPATPTLKENQVNGLTSIKVSWKKVTGSDGYEVFRKVGKGKWKSLAKVSGGSKVSYTDKNVTPGVDYAYSVRAWKKQGGKTYFGAYDKTGKQSTLILQAPVLVNVTSSGTGSAKVTWKKVSAASGYRVYRKTGKGKWATLATVSGGSKVSYTDNSIAAGNSYTYTVMAYVKKGSKTYWGAYDSVGLSVNSLGTPGQLKAQAQGGDTIKFSWGAVSGASGYRIMRKSGATGWSVLKDVSGQGTTSYLDKDVSAGVNYTYTVRAYAKQNGVTVYGNYDQTGVSAQTSLTTPVITSVTVNSSNDKVTVTWSTVPGVTGYRIFRRLSTSSTWTAYQTFGASSKSSMSMDDMAVVSGKTYFYNVKAYVTEDGKTVWSDYGSDGMSITVPVGSITIRDLEGLADQKVIDAFEKLEFKVEVDPTVSFSGRFSALSHNIVVQITSKSVLLHEVGHFLSFVANSADSTTEFKSIYNEEKSKYTGTNKAYVTQDSGEYFAESYRDYCENGSKLQSERPKTYNYIKESLDKVTDAQVSKIWNLYSRVWKAKGV